MGAIQIFDIGGLLKSTDITTFIESGTLYGDAIASMLEYDPGFDSLHSIEIIEELAETAKKRFEDVDKVHIHHGHSVDVLSKILPDIESNALFWLDAHFPGGDSMHHSYDDVFERDIKIPLERELDVISSRVGKYQDILIIDDLWVYEDCATEAGNFDEHMKKHGWNVRREDFGTNGTHFITKLFGATHDINKNYKHQGYVIVTPKQEVGP